MSDERDDDSESTTRWDGESDESEPGTEPDAPQANTPTEPDAGPVDTGEPPDTAGGQTRPERGADEVYCSSCGEVIKKDAEICPECGVRQQGTPQQAKNPGLAAVASFFFSGLGQIYNGQLGKGLILIVVQAVNVALMFVLVGFLTYPIVWIYGIWDAYKTAEKINSGEITV